MSVLVGRPAPGFVTSAVSGKGKIIEQLDFHKAIKGKYAVLLFYPLDFTFVCPSELIALDKRMPEFSERGVEVFSVSIDSHFTHNAWRNTPINQGGIGPVKYTMIADMSHHICKSYDVETADGNVAFRGTFLIDRKGIVRHQVVNDLPLGRNMDELLRVIDALQFFEEHGEVCPAGWQKGQKGMEATPEGVAKYLASEADKL